MNGLLLDTHVWFWMNENNSRLSQHELERIQDAATHAKLYIAAISLWEIAMMSGKSKISMDRSLDLWLTEALQAPGLKLLPLTPQIAAESVALPGNFHADPADQLIVATARVHDLALMTQDRKILDYAAQGHLKAIPG